MSPDPTWREFAIDELLDLSNGVNAGKAAYGHGLPFINVREVIANESLTIREIPGRVAVARTALDRYLVKRGDVLFNRTSETQEEVGLTSVYIGDDPVVFGGFVFRGCPKTANLDIDYSKYALRACGVRRQITSRGQGGIRANIGQRDLKSVRLSLPSVTEQRRIAHVIDDAQALVQCLERLSAKKQAIKQGMMQQLLTGQTRLPGFSAPWTEQTLGAVADVTMGQSPAGSTFNVRGAGLPLIQGNADIRGRATFDRIWTTAPTKTCDTGDVLLTVRAPVGYAAMASRRSCLGRGVCAIRAAHDNPFLFQALVYAEPSWALYEQGSTFTAVNSGEVRSFAVPWPSDVTERAAIAAVLADADRELNVLADRLAKARALKTGTMQQLLSGHVRLPMEGVAA